MSLKDWLANNLIEEHGPSPDEIADLLKICDRDLQKAGIEEIGPDWRVSIAHNAALQAATAALAAAGYRARKRDSTTGLYSHSHSPYAPIKLQSGSSISSVRNGISALMNGWEW